MFIELPILESTKDSQMQHGLKYENHQRYRSYCSRRLHRIRRSLNVHQGVASTAKARHTRGRKLMDINNAMVLEAGEKNPEYGERMLIIPLCLAERAWSHAMQLKQETSEHPRRRYHLVRRFKKASEHAQRFEKLCHDPESPCSERTKSEATAYAAYITGLYQVEREDWANAKGNLNKALSIYYKLSISVKKADILEHYRQRIDELRASLRYCKFSLGDQETEKQVQVKLPTTLNFHDLAFKHYTRFEEETTRLAKKQDPQVVQKQTEIADVDEDEDDEFEETREGVEPDVKEEDEKEEDDEEDDESEDDEDDRKKQQGSRVGGVTGLVKNWLGGAWS